MRENIYKCYDQQALISKIYNSSYNLISKNKQLNKKMGKDTNSHFSKEDIQMVANRHMKRY